MSYVLSHLILSSLLTVSRSKFLGLLRKSIVAFSLAGSTLGAIRRSPFSWSQVDCGPSPSGIFSGAFNGFTSIKCLICHSKLQFSGVFLTIAISFVLSFSFN